MNDPALPYLASVLRAGDEPGTAEILLWAHRYSTERAMIEGSGKPYLYAEKQQEDDVPFLFKVGCVAEAEPAPIDMVLHCPECDLQHIDAPGEMTR